MRPRRASRSWSASTPKPKTTPPHCRPAATARARTRMCAPATQDITASTARPRASAPSTALATATAIRTRSASATLASMGPSALCLVRVFCFSHSCLTCVVAAVEPLEALTIDPDTGLASLFDPLTLVNPTDVRHIQALYPGPEIAEVNEPFALCLVTCCFQRLGSLWAHWSPRFV